MGDNNTNIVLDISMSPTSYSQLQYEEIMTTLQQSNQHKLEAAKQYLGTKWVLHPDNSPVKKEYAPVLGSGRGVK